jgi:hypothetical protein
MGSVQGYYCAMHIQHKQTRDLWDARVSVRHDANTGINVIGNNRRYLSC